MVLCPVDLDLNWYRRPRLAGILDFTKGEQIKNLIFAKIGKSFNVESLISIG